MELREIINLTGAWVVLKKADGTTHKGFLDKIGATQNSDSIILANQDPSSGEIFKGRTIKIGDIESVSPGVPGETNI